MRIRRGVAVAGATLIASVGSVAIAGFSSAPADAQQTHQDGARTTTPTTKAAPGLVKVWSSKITDSLGGKVALSSPSFATLAGSAAAVFGDRSGMVYALSLATGSPITGWPRKIGEPVTSTPSAWRQPGSKGDTILVGAGNAANPCAGGYEWLLPTGSTHLVRGPNPREDHKCAASGVSASIAIGRLGGTTAAVAGTLGQNTYAFSASTRRKLPGFPWFQGDTNFATPAVADVRGGGANQIVEGGAQSAGYAFKKHYTRGGHIRVVSASGKLLCDDTTDESVNSSPAVGDFLAGTAPGIVAGTGPTFPDAPQRDDVIAVNGTCHQVWSRKLAGTTGYESPALADVLGDGALQVIVTTHSGAVYALDGANGATLWTRQLGHDILGSPVTAELGTGSQDVVVATTAGFDVLAGQDGAVVDSTVLRSVAFQNAPLVTHDANGTIGITVAGYQKNDSVVAHFEIVRSDARNVDALGTWPQFHHDPQLTGDANYPIAPTSATTTSRADTAG